MPLLSADTKHVDKQPDGWSRLYFFTHNIFYCLIRTTCFDFLIKLSRDMCLKYKGTRTFWAKKNNWLPKHSCDCLSVCPVIHRNGIVSLTLRTAQRFKVSHPLCFPFKLNRFAIIFCALNHGGLGYGLITARRRLVYFEQANDMRQALPDLFVLVWLGVSIMIYYYIVTQLPFLRSELAVRLTRSQPVGH